MKIGRKRVTYSLNESVNYDGACRTAPATPGLLKTFLTLTLINKRYKRDIVLRNLGRDQFEEAPSSFKQT